MEQKNKKILYGLVALIALGVSVRMVKTMQNQGHNAINLATAKGPEIARFINNNVDNGGHGPINIFAHLDQQHQGQQQDQHEGIHRGIQLLQAIQLIEKRKGVAQKQITRWKKALKENYFINADHFGRLYTGPEIADLRGVFIHLAAGAPDAHNIEEVLNVFTQRGGAPTQAFMEAARQARGQAHHNQGQRQVSRAVSQTSSSSSDSSTDSENDDDDDNQGQGHGSRTPSRSTSFSASSVDSVNGDNNDHGQAHPATPAKQQTVNPPMTSSSGAFNNQTAQQQTAAVTGAAAAAQQQAAAAMPPAQQQAEAHAEAHAEAAAERIKAEQELKKAEEARKKAEKKAEKIQKEEERAERQRLSAVEDKAAKDKAHKKAIAEELAKATAAQITKKATEEAKRTLKQRKAEEEKAEQAAAIKKAAEAEAKDKRDKAQEEADRQARLKNEEDSAKRREAEAKALRNKGKTPEPINPSGGALRKAEKRRQLPTPPAAAMQSSGGATGTQTAAEKRRQLPTPPAKSSDTGAAAVAPRPLTAAGAAMTSSKGGLKLTKNAAELAVTRAQQQLSLAAKLWENNHKTARHPEDLKRSTIEAINNAHKAIKQYEDGNHEDVAFSKIVKQLLIDTNKLYVQVMGNKSMPE